MDSLQRRRLMQFGLVAIVCLALGGMIVFNAWRPAQTQTDVVRQTSDVFINTDWRNLGPEQREAMRQEWENLPPEVRQQVFNEIARHRLTEIREETAKLTPEQRRDRIQELVQEMRQRQRELPAEERERIRERLNSEDGRQMVRRAMDFYMKELTAKERAELDPLLHEWLYQIEQLRAG